MIRIAAWLRRRVVHLLSPARLRRPRRTPSTTAPAPDAPGVEGLIRALDANDRFHRDGRLSGIFHPGRISYREIKPRDSLHIVLDGSRVSAHMDEVCPLQLTPDGGADFSLPRVIAHNVRGAMGDLNRILHGRHGEQRCNLGCEVVWVDDDQIGQAAADLQEGRPVDLSCDKPS